MPPWPPPAPPEMSAQSLCGTSTSTPPTASIRSSKPVKSTIATWSIWMPRNFSTVLICSAAPPKAKAALIFCGALAGDFGVAVARDREFAEGAAAGADQHQRVGAVFAGFAAVVGGVAVRLLFEALLRVRRAGLLGVGRAGVGAEDEDRLRAGQQERVAVQGVLRFAGELEGLQLGGDGEGEEAEQDPAQSRDPDPFEHPLERRRAAAGRPPLAVRLAIACQAASQAALRAPAGRERSGDRSREKRPLRDR